MTTAASTSSPASPATDRDGLEATALRILLSLRPHASEDHALINLPGAPSQAGEQSDGYEGFCRSILLAGFYLAGRDGQDPHGIADWYARGITAGLDPESPHAWPRNGSLGQANVESCVLALALDMTRPWILDRLEGSTRERLGTHLAEVVGMPIRTNNWVWFRIVVETFLRSLGEDYRRGVVGRQIETDLAADLAMHDSQSRHGGWFDDGNVRGFDHYNAWAFANLPALWLRMQGQDIASPERTQAISRHLGEYTRDALGLVGADGSPLIQGRSLIYRMGVAAPFWATALDGGTGIAPGALRRAGLGIVDHFVRHGAPDKDGILTKGWFHPFEAMAQNYSGPGSPLWASHGFLGLAMGPSHPVWTDTTAPLAVTDGAQGNAAVVDALPAPGWVRSRTPEDGIVRIHNHGTDHAGRGVRSLDDPWYARLGYSTATAPLLDTGEHEDPRSPWDMTAALWHEEHGWSHRSGFVAATCSADGSLGVGRSRGRVRWDVEGEAPLEGPVVDVLSIVRGATEVRVVRVSSEPSLEPVHHRVGIGGWAVASATEPQADVGRGIVRDDRLTSSVSALRGELATVVRRSRDASPLGPFAAAPGLVGDVGEGEIIAARITLGAEAPVIGIDVTEDGSRVTVRWEDGVGTSVALS